MPSAWTQERDRRLLLSIFAANRSVIKLDYDYIAQLCGNTTKASVDHRLRVIKKEAQQLVQDLDDGISAPLAKPVARTPKKKSESEMKPKKRKWTEEGTPTKKAAKVKNEANETEEEEELTEEFGGYI
ncbi:hypothetical protein K440DRAFT_633018 [Wilcoxina mikolae CBS 423.85]|nr:hypothetical protein K440DRAFT_633018 [Wilcoxina mikolae CBS 423.85]